MQADSAAPGAVAPVPTPVAPEPTAVAQPETTSPEVESEPSLFDEAESDAVERPEWLPEKFKSAEDLSKSYQELEKKLGAHQGAPDEYTLEIREELHDYAITNEDPFAQDFAKILKDNGVNQKTYNDVSNLYFEKMKAEEESIAIAQDHQFTEDCKNLGDEKLGEIKESIKWAKEVLPEETYTLLRDVGNKDITIGLMINQFHEAYTSKNYTAIPESQQIPASYEDMKLQARQMMGDPRIKTDPVFQKKALDFYKKVYPD